MLEQICYICYLILFSKGIVKFNGILPWEVDGDIVFQSANYSVLKSLTEKFKKAGYTLNARSAPKVDKNGRLAGGYFMMGTTSWRIELWGYAQFESQMAVANGQVTTIIIVAERVMGVQEISQAAAGCVRSKFGVSCCQLVTRLSVYQVATAL